MNVTIQQLIDTKAPMQFKDGAEEYSIKQYEETANIKLPSAYREWLQYSNGGEIFVPGTVFYGVGEISKNSLIEANAQKKRSIFSLNESFHIIGRFNFGDLLCTDLISGEVIQWDHEKDEEFLRWLNFFEFVKEEIQANNGDGG